MTDQTPTRRPRGRPPTGSPSARDALLAEQTATYRAKRLKLEGSLIPVAEVQAGWRQICTATRAAMLALPTRLAARLPHLNAADLRTIEDEVRQALEQLAERGR